MNTSGKKSLAVFQRCSVARPSPVLVRLVSVMAHQLPSKQVVREAEWLAELEELPAGLAQLGFVCQCALATLRMQPQPVWSVIRWSGQGILIVLKRLRKALTITEHDTIRMQTPELMHIFSPHLTKDAKQGAPEDSEPVRFDFDEKTNPARRE